MKDRTPQRFQCGTWLGSCPAIFEKEDGRLVIIGARVSNLHASKVGVGEEAIEIDPGLLEDIIRAACGLTS